MIPNKYPALQPINDTAASSTGRPVSHGVQEVIIESPRHVVSVTELSPEEIIEALTMCRDRLQALHRLSAVRFGLLFKNVGPTAGASIEHTHSQLIGLPEVPQLVAQEIEAAMAYDRLHGRCIFCDLIELERAAQVRMVHATSDFVAFCPYAARFPFKTWLMPTRHCSRFECASNDEIRTLAPVLRDCIKRIESAVGPSNYNYLIHSAPFDTDPQSHYHWHIEIFPRMTTIAGFEWGTGQFINPVPPEDAAKVLAWR